MFAVLAVIAFGIAFILALLNESWTISDGVFSFVDLGLVFLAAHFVWDVYGTRFNRGTRDNRQP